MTTICVDAMGGDEKPEVVCAGIAAALAADEDLEVLVAGDESVVVPFCTKNNRAKPLVTTQVIGMAEHPAEAVRTKRDSSIVQGCKAVRSGDADAFFSAGSTGAILTAGTLHVGRVKGVTRAALAVAMPGLEGHETVVLDVGASADCRPEMLVQFAHMGRAYSHILFGITDPTVGLLSNGSEETKGSEAALANHAALRDADCGFVGNAEGSDLLTGNFDVIVCDGFTGNVALKTIEGTAKFIVAQLKAATKTSKKVGIGALMIKPALLGVKGSLSGDYYGGAVLLGLKAPVLVGHGATSVQAIKNGTLAAARIVRGELVGKVAEACAHLA